MHPQHRCCRLKYFEFPKYWEELSELIDSTEHAFARMQDIEQQYASNEGEHICVYFEDSLGDKLYVGLAGESWMITHLHRVDEYDIEYLYAVGNKEAEGHVAFLFPEWTDVSQKALIPKSKAQEVVELWINKGILSNSIEWTYDLL